MNYILKLLGVISLTLMVALSGCITDTNTNNNQNANNQVQTNTNGNINNNMGLHNYTQNHTPGAGRVVGQNGNINTTMLSAGINAFPKEPLSEEEKLGLIEMREEEKLARDVYLTLYDKWKIPVFQNIANAELSHTTSVKLLLDKYNISDPADNSPVGVFKTPKYQKLYNELVEKGSKSEIDALIVGATIEDLDIYDLQQWSAKTDSEDILYTYANLEKGSRNHMRSFIRTLKNYGGNYTPQYISQEEFDQIINSQVERGPVNR